MTKSNPPAGGQANPRFQNTHTQDPRIGSFGVDLQFNARIFQLNRGFTLIELLVAVFGFTIILLGLVALVSSVFVGSNKQSNLLADTDQARRVAFSVINQLRNAQTSSTGAYALETAEGQQLSFYSNVDKDPLIERVRYYVQDGKLYQGITKPAGDPVAYNPAHERIFAVQNNLANGTSPLFYYYDGSYDGSTDSYLPQPVSVTAVRFAKLDLRIFNKAGMDQNNSYSVTASGAVRNLKDNLGEGPQGVSAKYQLVAQVSPAGTGSVAVSPAGPDYDYDTLVNLSAYPDIGYEFSSWAGDVADPNSQTTTIVMDDNHTITANLVAIPATLTGSISTKSGSQSSRRWTLRIRNNNSYWVNNTNLYSFSLTQTAGSACSPTLESPAGFPVPVGNITPEGTRTYQVRIDFSGCPGTARFTADFSFAGNSGADWGSASITNQAY